jgi:hypothetical protein
VLPERARHLRDDALAEWRAGRYYEAHEILEDLAECFEEEDPSFEWALAMTRVAACLHKLSSEVGVKAVPGKLKSAMGTLAGAPADWCGFDLGAFRIELQALAERVAPVAEGGAVPADLRYPVPGTIAAKPEAE